jgi:biopolymer transport protein ExbD
MTDINQMQAASRHRPGVRRQKKHSLRTDMTPMVDLGFLLVTFFVFTSELSRPRVSDLMMPKEGKAMPVGASHSLTILLGKSDRIFYYEGYWDISKVGVTNYSTLHGIGMLIRDKQEQLDNAPVNGEGRDGLMLMIKPGVEATYKNIIDALDEVLINGVKKYAVTKMEKVEVDYLLRH